MVYAVQVSQKTPRTSTSLLFLRNLLGHCWGFVSGIIMRHPRFCLPVFGHNSKLHSMQLQYNLINSPLPHRIDTAYNTTNRRLLPIFNTTYNPPSSMGGQQQTTMNITSTSLKYVDHTYHDFSNYIIDGGELTKHKKSDNNFPARLHKLVSDGHSNDVITWMVSRCVLYIHILSGRIV